MGTQVKTTLTDIQGLGAKGELKTAFTNSSACNSLTSQRFLIRPSRSGRPGLRETSLSSL